jgi:hypothetical protein
MRFAFDASWVNERGAGVAIFDYAFYLREHLGCDPLVFYNRGSERHNQKSLDRFIAQFECVPYADAREFQTLVDQNKVEMTYYLKFGNNDGHLAESTKNLVHVYFRRYEPHGDVYAYVSSWLSQHMSGGRLPFVPHMVDLPPPRKGFRDRIGIPIEAFVVGRHGGFDQFDLPFVHDALLAALAYRRDLYAVFLNTRPFCNHERVRFLPALIDPQQKSDFIDACDMGLHGRRLGESFGLAIAEFLALNRPVAAWRGGPDRNHVALIPDHRFLYRTARDLENILSHIGKRDLDGPWRRVVEPFSPAAVMAAFEEVFIKGKRTSNVATPIGQKLTRRAERTAQLMRDSVWAKGLSWRDRKLFSI